MPPVKSNAGRDDFPSLNVGSGAWYPILVIVAFILGFSVMLFMLFSPGSNSSNQNRKQDRVAGEQVEDAGTETNP